VALALVAFGTLAFNGVVLVGQNQRAAADPDVHVLPVRGNVYMIVGDGSNVAVSVGGDGALIVDSGAGRKTDKIVAAVQQLLKTATGVAPTTAKPCLGCAGLASPYLNTITASPAEPKPIRYLINTSALSDHIAGNLGVVKAGRTITGGDIVLEILGEAALEVAPVLAHENVLIRMSASDAGKAPMDPDALPSEVFEQEQYRLSQFINGEGIQLFHRPAITDGDTMVYFRYSDVLVTGDIFVTTTYPMIDLNKGGSIQGVLDGLNQILDIAVPETRSQGGTMISPGHGRLSDFGDVAAYRDMATIVRDRVQDAIKKGMTLQQVKAAKLTIDYDPRYATDSWTADMFIEAVYRSLQESK
jgi:glyoxylase-like metal-dependent hydrolase (beta-lactamase superfamily II)